MKRRTFLLAAASAAGCTRDRRPRLNVFNWSAYLAPETLTGFTRETGIRVRYAVYESNEEMLAKVMTGNSGWDVVFPTHSRIAPMTRAGLVAELDHRRLPHLGQLAEPFQRPEWDPGLTRSVPYMWNGTGIAYAKQLEPPPRRWADLWDERLRGRLTMLDDPEDAIGACLLKAGLPFDASDADGLARAKAEAVEQKKLVRAYLNAEVRDQLVAGDLLASQLWSTTAQQAIRASGSVAFAYPEEGFPLYCDNAVILRESERREQAHAFLDYLLRPEVAAANAQSGDTATANAGGRRLLPDAVRESRVLYPDAEMLRRGFWPKALPREAQKRRDRLWTEIKST